MTTPASISPNDGRKKKLFAKEWLEIVSLANQGKPAPEIATLYGVDQSVIYKGLRKRKVFISEVSKRIEQELAEKEKEVLLKKIKETKTLDYQAATLLKMEMLGIANRERVKAATEKRDPKYGQFLEDAKALKMLAEGLKVGHDITQRILGLDRENKDADAVLPELPIMEMTGLEVEQMRLQQAIEDGLNDDEKQAILDAGLGDEDDDELADVVDTDPVPHF